MTSVPETGMQAKIDELSSIFNSAVSEFKQAFINYNKDPNNNEYASIYVTNQSVIKGTFSQLYELKNALESAGDKNASFILEYEKRKIVEPFGGNEDSSTGNAFDLLQANGKYLYQAQYGSDITLGIGCLLLLWGIVSQLRNGGAQSIKSSLGSLGTGRGRGQGPSQYRTSSGYGQASPFGRSSGYGQASPFGRSIGYGRASANTRSLYR